MDFPVIPLARGTVFTVPGTASLPEVVAELSAHVTRRDDELKRTTNEAIAAARDAIQAVHRDATTAAEAAARVGGVADALESERARVAAQVQSAMTFANGAKTHADRAQSAADRAEAATAGGRIDEDRLRDLIAQPGTVRTAVDARAAAAITDAAVAAALAGQRSQAAITGILTPGYIADTLNDEDGRAVVARALTDALIAGAAGEATARALSGRVAPSAAGTRALLAGELRGAVEDIARSVAGGGGTGTPAVLAPTRLARSGMGTHDWDSIFDAATAGPPVSVRGRDVVLVLPGEQGDVSTQLADLASSWDAVRSITIAPFLSPAQRTSGHANYLRSMAATAAAHPRVDWTGMLMSPAFVTMYSGDQLNQLDARVTQALTRGQLHWSGTVHGVTIGGAAVGVTVYDTRVRLSGTPAIAGGSDNGNIGRLPNGFGPARRRTLPLPVENHGVVGLSIDPDGQLTVAGRLAPGAVIDLDAIEYDVRM